MMLPRFQLIRVDRTRERGKKKDRGLAVVGVTLGTSLKEQLCGRGIKSLAWERSCDLHYKIYEFLCA